MTAGRLCIRYDLRAAPSGPSHCELYRAFLDQVAWSDEHLALDAVVVSEHHGSPDGYSPAPLELAAAVAAVTRHAQIQISALIAPLHEPVRLAESAAVVDLLSGGRLEMVFVGGYRPSEYELLERPWATRGKMVEETAVLLRRIWAGEPPVPGVDTVVTPSPVRDEGPKILFGGASKSSAHRAARLGDGFIPGGGRFDLVDVYLEERKRLGKPAGILAGGAAPLAVHVSADVDGTWDRIGSHLAYDAWMYACYAAESSGQPNPSPLTIEEVRDQGRYRVVTPDQAVELWSDLEPTAMFFLHPLVGGMPPEEGWVSLRLFAKEVLPHLDRSN